MHRHFQTNEFSAPQKNTESGSFFGGGGDQNGIFFKPAATLPTAQRASQEMLKNKIKEPHGGV